MFGAVIGFIALAYYYRKMGPVLAFWIAYLLTRPLGASVGDYLSQGRDAGGLALGTVGTSAVFLATILALVVYLTAPGATGSKPPDAHAQRTPPALAAIDVSGRLPGGPATFPNTATAPSRREQFSSPS